MVGKKIKLLILAAGVFTLPIASLRADVDWVPVGSSVDSAGYAINANGNYAEGDRIVNVAPSASGAAASEGGAVTTPALRFHGGKRGVELASKAATGTETTTTGTNVTATNIQFAAAPGSNVLNIYGLLNKKGKPCSLKIDGDITVEAIKADAVVNVKTDVVFEPYVDPTGGNFTGDGFAQVYFNAAAGKTINVNLDGNMEFNGHTANTSNIANNGLRSPSKVVTRKAGGNNIDMIVTFAGQGKTVFKMADGKTIKFLGDIDGTAAVDVQNDYFFDSVANDVAGTKVFITMENTKQAVEDGFSKVVFQRKNYADETLRNLVVVGNNSIITYVATDITGLAHKADPTKGGFAAVAFDPSNKGAGRLGLFILGAYTFGWEDPKFTVDDPEYWQIVFKYPFNEGSVVVAGHKVSSYSPADIRNTLNYSIPAGGQAYFRVSDDLQYENRNKTVAYDPAAADRRGLLVVNDVQSVSKRASDPYWDRLNGIIHHTNPAAEGAVAPAAEGTTPAVLRSNVKRAATGESSSASGATSEGASLPVQGYDWSYSRFVEDASNLRNVRNGFVVGVNGVLDVYHNRFVDYVAGSVNTVDLLAENDYKKTKGIDDINTLLKAKNPAALILDGLDNALFVDSLSKFEAANPATQANPMHGQFVLRGDGAVLLRASGSSKEKVGYIFNFWKLHAPSNSHATPATPVVPSVEVATPAQRSGKTKRGGAKRHNKRGIKRAAGETVLVASGETAAPTSTNPLDIPTLDWDSALIVGESEFNGYNLLPVDDSVQHGQGEHVLEVEGKSSVNGWANTTVKDLATNVARNYAKTISNDGSVRPVSTAINFAGADVNARPLTRGNSYLRYNSPNIFLNNNIAFHNSRFVHSDVTKLVDGVPSSSEPAIVGGERLIFAEALHTFDGVNGNTSLDRDRYRLPEFQLYNATLDLKESLNAAGVRFVVRDIPAGVAGGVGQAANNTSVVRFYDHGDASDTAFSGHGRMFMLGSLHNLMADKKTNNWVTQSAYCNVFKRNKLSTDPKDPSASVTLSLKNGNQFPQSVSSTQYDSQRAIHYVLMSNMNTEKQEKPAKLAPGAKAKQVIDHNGVANVAIGWPTINGDSSASYPYDNTYYSNKLLQEELSSNAADLFSVDGLITPQATMSVDGYNIAFAGFDVNGSPVLGPITKTNGHGVVYVNHGGKISVSRPAGNAFTSIPYQAIVDTFIGQKVWNDYNAEGNDRVSFLSGAIDLPHDQATFTKNGAIQPYGLTADMFAARSAQTEGYVRLSVENLARSSADRSGANEVTINWFNREGDNEALISAASRFKGIQPTKKIQTRAMELVRNPITRPANLLYIGAGDDIAQLRVAGATQADPFVIDVSGDSVQPNVARVREFASLPSTLSHREVEVIGEGAHALLFVEFGGRFGLGSRDWNESSINPWNILGKNYVQVAPLGDGIVDLNSNLIVADNKALLATTSFGAAQQHRLTFFSENGYEVRVPAGVELDLSSFGQSANQQQIAFGGNARLVLEEGAAIRFPEASDVKGGVVLYFNDDSQLVFEGKIDPQTVTQTFKTAAAANVARIKILGKGQIWPNKNARVVVNGSVLVGVQADEITPNTDVTFSLNRKSSFEIGTPNLSGGAFEVGNPINVPGSSINFSMVTIGGSPVVHIDRQGFFGLGAGVIDKNGVVNGKAAAANNPVIDPTTTKAALDANGFPTFTPDTTFANGWTVQALNNVNNINIKVATGNFEHNNIVDGSGDNASLMAVGPAANYSLIVNGAGQATVKGGGNLMLVPAGATMKANVWDYAGTLTTGEQYGLMGSSANLLSSKVVAGTPFGASGQSFATTSQAEFFNVLALQNFSDLSAKVVPAGLGTNDTVVGFQNLDSTNSKYPATQPIITRQGGIGLLNGKISDVLIMGAVAGIESGAFGPTTFGAIAEQN